MKYFQSGKRVEDSKVRARERAADAKKIQDLQRQVKEMEQILKRRNPNSLPTLMMAAAAAPDSSQQGNRSAYTEVLEKRVKKLEAELEQKDGEADTRLRGVEQKYNSVKVWCYFSHILEILLWHINTIKINIRATTRENQQSAYAKTKTQISFAVTAKLISAFVFATRIVQFLFYLNSKFQASSSFLCLYRLVSVGPVWKPHYWFSHEVAHLFKFIIVLISLRLCNSKRNSEE